MCAEDAWAFLAVHRAAIREIAAADYPAVVIEAWAPLPVTEDDVERLLVNRDGEVRLVAELGGRIVGLGAIVPQNAELRACYVAPGAARTGVGTAIVREIERIARQHRLAFLELDSSLTAEPFYRSLGYVALGRIVHRLGSGQPMASVKMRKNLPG
jgi:putative acetyltransferase